jgi:hypothetical protein
LGRLSFEEKKLKSFCKEASRKVLIIFLKELSFAAKAVAFKLLIEREYYSAANFIYIHLFRTIINIFLIHSIKLTPEVIY